MEDCEKLTLVALLLLHRRKRRKQAKASTRKLWVKPWITRRKELGAYNNFIREIRSEDEETFRQFHRMDVQQFHDILTKVGPVIQREDTVMRESISPGERLAATLRFLATGV